MLTSLKEILENYLCICGYSVSVSLTVKLFNKKYISTEEFRDLKVYTAFRDRASYDQGKREIQDRVFTVMGNTDFLQCLKKEHFIKNNICINEPDYLNEHDGFINYYNSTMVVPIVIKHGGGIRGYFGYLCCDYKNTDGSVELFDENTANILFFYAQLYAHYFETLEYNWRDRIVDGYTDYDSFLDFLYKRKPINQC